MSMGKGVEGEQGGLIPPHCVTLYCFSGYNKPFFFFFFNLGEEFNISGEEGEKSSWRKLQEECGWAGRTSHCRMVVSGIRSQGTGLGWGSRWGRAGSGRSHCPVADLIQSLSRASSEKARAGWSLWSLSQEELKLLDCTEKLPQSSKVIVKFSAPGYSEEVI